MTSFQARRARILKWARILLIGLACLVGAYLVLVLAGGGLRPRLDDNFAWKSHAVLLFAHRGVAVAVPENSEASLAEARRLGFQAVEIDVRRTKDNELALLHDKTARRLLGLNAEFGDLTLAQLTARRLLFEGKETTNSVPTLRAIFQRFGKTLLFYLDTKDKGFKDADRIVALIDEFGLYDRTIVASVDPLFVAYVEHKYPNVNTALERFDFFQVCLYRLTPSRWKPDFLSGFARKMTPEHADWLRKEQLLSRRILYETGGTNYDRMLNFGISKAIVDYDPNVHSRFLSPPGASAP